MNCNCISEMNEKLKAAGKDLEISGVAINFTTGGTDLLIPTHVASNPFSKKKTPPIRASHCPFCGKVTGK